MLRQQATGGGVVPLKGGYMTLTEAIALITLVAYVIYLVVYIFRGRK